MPVPHPHIVPPGTSVPRSSQEVSAKLSGIIGVELFIFQRSSSDPGSLSGWAPSCAESSILRGPRLDSSSCPATRRTAVQTMCWHRHSFFPGGLSRNWCAGDGRGWFAPIHPLPVHSHPEPGARLTAGLWLPVCLGFKPFMLCSDQVTFSN